MGDSLWQWVLDRIKELRGEVKVALQKLADAIDRNKTIAKNYTDSTRRALEALIFSITSTYNNNFRELFKKDTDLQNQINSKVLNWVVGVRDFAIGLFNAANNKAISYAMGVRDYAKGLVNGVEKALPGLIKAIVGPAITGLIGQIGDIKSFIDSIKCIVSLIVKDPVNFLIRLLEFFFLEWIQYEIAYAFGTQEATLPSKPSFFKKLC